jgi:hypothetical protein
MKIDARADTSERALSSQHARRTARDARALVFAGLCAVVGAAGFGGCAAGEAGNSSGDTPSGAGGSGNSGSGAGNNSSGMGTGGGVLFDAGVHDGPENGCTAVDILFIIDNSSSMCLYQDALAQAFPFFTDAIYNALPAGTDLHVGVTTSAFCNGGSHGESNCVAGESSSLIDTVYQTPAEGIMPDNGYQGRLLEWDGKKFFAANTGDVASKTALSQWFSGAATAVGCGGCAFDFTVAGAGYAADPVNAPTNAGFLRDEEAVLLLFFLTDEADHSPEGLAFYHDQIASAKTSCGGDACIITGGLLSKWCNGPSAVTMTNIWQFVNMFGEAPIWGDIQAGGFGMPNPQEYVKIIADALTPVVKQTCDEIGIPK